MNKVLGFAPDMDQTTPGVLTDCANLLPCELGMRPALQPVPGGVAPIGAQVRGAIAAIALDGGRRVVAGTDVGLHLLAGTTWADVSGAAGPFALGDDERWAFAQLGDSTLAACPSEGLMLSNGSDFAPVADAPSAKILVSLKGFAMAFVTSDPVYGDSPDRWWCSAYLDAQDWTPDVATLCTTGRLVESGGEITAAHRLGDDVIVYKRRSTYVGRYTGPAEVWNFTMVNSDIGCVGLDAVCDAGAAHYFLGDDDVYAFDGVQVRSIGRGVLRDWYALARNPKSVHRSIAFWDQSNQLAWFFFPGGQSEQPDTGIVYHPASGRWGRADMGLRALLRYTPGATVYDGGGPAVGEYDGAVSMSFDSPFWTEAQQVVALFDANNDLVTLTGLAQPSRFVSGDFGDEDQNSWCDRLTLRLQGEPESATATGYVRDDAGPLVRVGCTSGRDDGAFDMRQRGRWHRFALEMTGGYTLVGLRPRLRNAGWR